MKKNLLLGTILMLGLAIAGCGSIGDSQIDRVEQNKNGFSGSIGMEADAPKTSDNQDVQKIESTKTENGSNKVENHSNFDNVGTENVQGNNDNASRVEITEEEAKDIVLKDAQVEATNVKKIRIERDRDDGRLIYDIDFYAGNKEYDYEIDLYTGEILSRDLDIEDDFYLKQNTQQNVQSSKLIDEADAIAIVLKKVPGATEKNVEIELDEDDGNWKYEGEIHYNKREYEFEISAKNGKILKWSEESSYD